MCVAHALSLSAAHFGLWEVSGTVYSMSTDGYTRMYCTFLLSPDQKGLTLETARRSGINLGYLNVRLETLFLGIIKRWITKMISN